MSKEFDIRTKVRQIQDIAEHLAPEGERRRKILKYSLFGVGAFVLGKVLGPSINLFPTDFGGNLYNFKNFRVVENDKELGFYDKLGNEILILEKDPNAGK